MQSQPIRIFLADDHRLFREGLGALVSRSADMTVVGECGGGSDVVELIKSCKPDVAVLDVEMPGMSGLDLCRTLTSTTDIAVVILTMHENEEFVARALDYGACGYVLKEAAAEQFLEAIHAAARGDIYFGPGIARSALRLAGRVVQDPYEQLTDREREVLKLSAEGLSSKQIASTLQIAFKTAATHRLNLMRKLDLHDQTSLVKFAIRKGLISLH